MGNTAVAAGIRLHADQRYAGIFKGDCMVETEDIKVWEYEDGTYEQHYYLDNGCITIFRISQADFKRLLCIYGGGKRTRKYD